jgi:hypothetical protein
MNFSFTPATRETARARIGLQGPAGCGKTKTALRIAEGLAQGGTIGLVDTERRSALTYAVVPGKPHLGGHEFGHMPMDSYDPRNLIQAVQAAEQARIAVLIVDSWSHFWNGRGGLLEIVESAGSGALGTFGGWKKGNPIEQDMLDALLNFSGHLIVTMRTKTDYLVDESGPKKKITKVGTKVVQRESSDYELGLIIDMVEGTGTVTKTRYEVLEGLSIHHPGEELGQQVLEQLGQGVDPVQVIVDELVTEGLTYARALELHARAKARNLLTAGHMHPVSGAPTTVDALIKEYGQAVKPVTTGVTNAPSAPPADQPSGEEYTGPSAHSLSDAEASAPAVHRTSPSEESTVTPVSAPQMRMMHALFNKLDVKERDARLRATSLIIGRPVASANELLMDEAKALLDTLTNYSEREDAPATFAAMVDDLAKQPA